MHNPALAGSSHHRSAAQQLEYWAALGREVAELIDPEGLRAVKTGLARLRVQPLRAAAVDPEQVFAALEDSRQKGTLSASVSTAAVRYQASSSHPGYLERINSDGSRCISHFADGVFQPCDPARP